MAPTIRELADRTAYELLSKGLEDQHLSDPLEFFKDMIIFGRALEEMATYVFEKAEEHSSAGRAADFPSLLENWTRHRASQAAEALTLVVEGLAAKGDPRQLSLPFEEEPSGND